MNETPPPEQKSSEWRNPQVVAPIVAAVCTVLVAVIGLLSNQMRANQVPVATIVVTAVVTQAPVETEAQAASPTTAESTPVSEPTVAQTTPTTATDSASSSNVTLFYDEDAFTVFNPSDSPVSIENVSFRAVGQDEPWDLSVWGNLADAIPPKQCIRLRDIAEESQEPPDSCPEEFYGFFKVGSGEVYWRDVAQFEVVQDDTVLATCEMSAGTCSFYVEP